MTEPALPAVDVLPSEPDALRAEAERRLGLLTDQQASFARHYAACGNATASARAAGYSESSARDLARRLKRHPDVLAAVRALVTLRTAEATLDVGALQRLLEAMVHVDADGYLERNAAGEVCGIRDQSTLGLAERARLKKLAAKIRRSAQGERAHVVSIEVELVPVLEVVSALAKLNGWFGSDGPVVNIATLGPAIIAASPIDPLLAEIADLFLDDAELAEFVRGDDAGKRRLMLAAAQRIRAALPERVQ